MGMLELASVRAQILDVRLAPPKRPLPEIAAEVATLDSQREKVEQELSQKLKTVYASTLATARMEVASLVASELRLINEAAPKGVARPSFFQARSLRGQQRGRADDFAVKVSAAGLPATDESIKDAMEKIEFKRADAERKLFEQACSELQALKKLALKTLAEQIREAVRKVSAPGAAAQTLSFLAATQSKQASRLPETTNVRVSASDEAFPTIADLVEDMEARRDVAETKGKAMILAMEQNVLQELNAVMKHELSAQIHQLVAGR